MSGSAVAGDDEGSLDLRKGIENVNIDSELCPSENQIDRKIAHDSQKKPKFEVIERPQPRIPLPDELWMAILECPCTFSSEIFNTVMLNLVQNPNLTSSHLFRADILYDSSNELPCNLDTTSIPDHLQSEYQPRPAPPWPNFHLTRTILRLLIPRNPHLDNPLLQTCHILHSPSQNSTLTLYTPHTSHPSTLPFYHPTVSHLAFHHTPQTLTLLYHPFPTHPLTQKSSRTALKLLQTIHKHACGLAQGYEKRVHHDQLIPQKRYQDTYARLKAKYGRRLSEQWVEVTDPGKHVFEEIGIAAFLVEVWGEMFPAAGTFPGFVDIGCGNGVLVYLLVSEGYEGWGFDARERKTWKIFPEGVQGRLRRRVLVPRVLQDAVGSSVARREVWHDGVFEPGTFIVSNHADELTPWTPLLAYLNESAFVAIPCCSHDLAGAKFRAPATTKAGKEGAKRLPQQESMGEKGIRSGELRAKQAAETGSLKRTEAQKKMPSAYSTLCSFIASLAMEMGFEPELDVLRIPSTRNSCIVGRKRQRKISPGHDKTQDVINLIERELKKEISVVSGEWIERAEKLMKKPSSGH